MAAASCTPMVSPATGLDRPGWRDGSWPLAWPVAATRSPSLPLFGRRQRFLPPEPFRFIGARAIREALIRQDDALDAGRRPGLLTRLVARLPSLLGYRFRH